VKIAVLGATGKTGRYLVAQLVEDGHDVTAVGRDPARLDALDTRAGRAVANLERPATIGSALDGVDCIVSLAHARFTEAVLAAVPASCGRIVLTGSTRRFTRLTDPAADAVRKGEAAFRASRRSGVFLHPSMIYGAPDDRNVNRILHYIRRWPRALPVVVPLPDGGRHLVQPVFVDDVVDAFVAATTRPEAPGEPIVIAGPEPISYADMVRQCAAVLGRTALILPFPAGLLKAVIRLAKNCGLPAPFDAAEITRASEDKTFDVSDLQERLGITPRSFAAGLSLKIERRWG
jgi:nucleoside-diphosphate-sugar epimerase